MNPLMDDLSKLTDAQVSERINAIYDRMRFFNQSGNTGAYQQANNIYLALQEEMKQRAVMRYYNPDEDDDFGDMIDIKK